MDGVFPFEEVKRRSRDWRKDRWERCWFAWQALEDQRRNLRRGPIPPPLAKEGHEGSGTTPGPLDTGGDSGLPAMGVLWGEGPGTRATTRAGTQGATALPARSESA